MSKAHRAEVGWKHLARDVIARGRQDDAPCVRCGRPIDYSAHHNSRNAPTADHLEPIALGGQVMTDQVAVAHRGCNSRHGARMGNAMRAAGVKSRAPEASPQVRPTLHVATEEEDYDGGPLVAVAGEIPAVFLDCPWMQGLFPVPEDATWPRLMSDPHPEAVGTMGWGVIKRIEKRREEDMLTPKKAKKLRWWQRLVIVRLYEYKIVDGEMVFCWEQAILSTSRQVGKSVLMREIALDRIQQFEHFGEAQLVLHVAKDLSIANEIQRPSRQWADMLERRGHPWHSVGNNGQWAVEYEGMLGRWLIRAQKAVYGYSACVAMVDEGWAIDEETISEGIEPTMAERDQPLLLLISTAHAECSTLMPTRRNEAMKSMGGGEKLLIEWSAPEEAKEDPTRAVYVRMASPYWSDHRKRFVMNKMLSEGAIEQWLNIWPNLGGNVETLIGAELWEKLRVPTLGMPRGAGVGRTLVMYPDLEQSQWHVIEAATGDNEVAHVRMIGTLPSIKEALSVVGEAAKGSSVELIVPRVIRGRVPKMAGVRAVILAGESDMSAAATTVRPMLISGRVRHDGSALLTEQVVGAVIETYGETIRISAKSSPGPVEAAKAAVLGIWWSSRLDRPRAVVV